MPNRLPDPSAPPGTVATGAAAVGRRAGSWLRPECGLSAAERFLVTCTDGTRVFVKAATDEPTAHWLRTEREALDVVGPALGPRVLAWRDDVPLLVTECLDGYWPAGTGTTAWRTGDAPAVFAALDRLRTTPVPAELPAVTWPSPTWRRLVDGPALVDAGLCDRRWLRRHGEALARLDESAEPTRTAIVHGDVRSDNICIDRDGRARLVDWSQTGAGHPLQDLVEFLPTLPPEPPAGR